MDERVARIVQDAAYGRVHHLRNVATLPGCPTPRTWFCQCQVDWIKALEADRYAAYRQAAFDHEQYTALAAAARACSAALEEAMFAIEGLDALCIWDAEMAQWDEVLELLDKTLSVALAPEPRQSDGEPRETADRGKEQ